MNKKLDSINMLSFIFHAMIGLELIIVPQTSAEYAKTDAWMVPIVSGFIILITCCMGFWVCERYPDLNWAQINNKVLGGILGRACLILIIFYIVLINGISLRFFTESINTFLLEDTPTWVTKTTFLILIYYCMKKDMKTISIIFDILMPYVLFFIVFLIILASTSAEPKNLLPVLNRGILPVVKGALYNINSVGGAYVVLFILTYFNKPKETKKYLVLGIIVTSIIYLCIVMLCVMIFGDTELLYITFPTLTLSKSIQINIQLLERAESLFMTAWIPIAFTALVTYNITGISCTKELFNTQKDNLILIIELILAFIISIIPKNMGEVFKLLTFSNIFMVGITFIYYPAITLITFVRNRGGKNKTNNI